MQSDNEPWSVNRKQETFFLGNHPQNVVAKLVTDPFLKN